MKSKAATGAPAKEEKQKGLALFGQKPPTPKLLKAFGNLRKGGLLDKLKVKTGSVGSNPELLVKPSLLFAERSGGGQVADVLLHSPSCGGFYFLCSSEIK